MSESLILRQIMLALNRGNSTRVWRNNQGVAHYPNGSVVRYGIANPGGSDLLGVHNGRFVAIEVKAPRGRVSQPQKRFLQLIRDFGGIAGVARSVEDARELING